MNYRIKHAYIASAELTSLQGVELTEGESLDLSFKPPTAVWIGVDPARPDAERTAFVFPDLGEINAELTKFTFVWSEMDFELLASVTGWMDQFLAEPIRAHLPTESPRCLRPTPWRNDAAID